MRTGVDGTWSRTGVKASSGPSATVTPDGTVMLFVRGLDNRVAYASLRGSTWSGVEQLDGTITSAPAGGQRRGTNVIDLFVRGDDGNLYHRIRQSDGTWTPFGSLGGPIVDGPATASRRDNFVDVYVHGTDGSTYAKYNDGTDAGWQGFLDVEKQTLTAPGLLAPPGSNNLEVLVRSTDRALWRRTFAEPGNGFGPWAQVDPQRLDSAPAGAAADGRLYVFARSGGDVLVKTIDSSATPWRSLGPVALPAEEAPSSPGSPVTPSQPPGTPGTPEGQIRFDAGIGCTPRGQRLAVSADVRKRKGRAKPRVRFVKFFYRKGKGRVTRTDRRAPFKRTIPVDLEPGTYRVYAQIHYKRPGKRKLGVKTVSKRFVVCA